MNRFIVILLILFTSDISAQMQEEAISTENNVMVYREAGYHAESVYTLQENEVFLIAENEESNSEWLYVEISKNKFCKTSENGSLGITGFVPKAKIVLIDSLPKNTTNEIVLEFKVVKANKWQTINENNTRYGLDIPLSLSFAVSEMHVNWGGKRIKQNKIVFDDLFNISFRKGTYSSKNNTRFTVYERDNIYFIKQKCADGSGSYEITWVVKDGVIIQRMIDDI